MNEDDPRSALIARMAELPGESLASLSRLVGRNAAYLQQWVRRGSPRVLPERERRVLAGYLGMDERRLGGPSTTRPPRTVPVRRLDVAASAGPGAINGDDPAAGAARFAPELLRGLGVGGGRVSLIRARGDSMAPGIADGDELLVDEGDRRVDARGGVFVIRLGDALMVKRVARAGGRLCVTSDNPDAGPVADGDRAEVIGRVVWLARALGGRG